MSEPAPSFRNDVVTVVDRASIDSTPWQPLRGLAGVNHRVLWRMGDMIVGIVRLEPGAKEPGHGHHDADHHVYVLDGSARIGGRPVGAGSFAFVPAGVTHETSDVGPEGCTLLYTYVTRPRP
jgi:uncharacterized RmlC-like cupin family protein